MHTINQLAVKLHQEVVATLLRNLKAMPDDKLTWKPLGQGRTVLSQLQECAIMTGLCAEALKTRRFPEYTDESYNSAIEEIDHIALTVESLKINLDRLIREIDNFPSDELEKTLLYPWDDKPKTFAELMMMNYWNLSYHEGQIAYIQSLY